MSEWSFVTRVLEKDQQNRSPCFPLPRLQAFIYSTWSKPPKRVDVLSYYVYKLHIELILSVVEATWWYHQPQKSSIAYPLTKDDLSPKDQYAYCSQTLHDLKDRLKTIRDSKLSIDWEAPLSRPPHSEELQKDALRENLFELQGVDEELNVMSSAFMSQLKTIAGRFREDVRPQMEKAYQRLMFMIEQTHAIQKRIIDLDQQDVMKDFSIRLKELDELQKELRKLELHEDKHQKELLALIYAMEKEEEKSVYQHLDKISLGKKHDLYSVLKLLKKHYSNKPSVWEKMLEWRHKQLQPHAKREYLTQKIHDQQASQSELHKKAEFFASMREQYTSQYRQVHDQWEAWYEETIALIHTSQKELQKSYEIMSTDFLIEESLWRNDLKESWLSYMKGLNLEERKQVKDQYEFLKQQALRPPLRKHMSQWHNYFDRSKGRVWELMETIEPSKNALLFWFYLLKLEFVMMLWI